MTKRRGSRRSTATVAKALLLGGSAALALNSIVSPSSSAVVEAASSPSASIRGSGGNTSDSLSSTNSNNKRIGNTPRRPAILDSHQGEKIEQWKVDTANPRKLAAAAKKDEALFNSILPHVTPSGKRRLYDYMTVHKKQSGTATHVEKVEEDTFHFQTVPPTTTTTTATTTSTTTTSTSSSQAASIVANSQSSNYYYPISTPDHTVGTCTNNGNEPDHYTLTNGFLYTSLEECCAQWFVKAEECEVGFATAAGGDGDELLLRDPYTGVLLSDMITSNTSESSSPSSGGGVVYYPSFDMDTYPDGACLNDGQQPEVYTAQDGYLFESMEECCHDWFIDEEGCERASSSSSTTTTQGMATETEGYYYGDEPVPSPALEGTDYPTWQDDDEVDDDQDTSQFSFYESFESGDFFQHDWILSSSEGADSWEADQSAWAYDGFYAARPGVLSEPDTQSNLTISLEDVQAVQHGGYLTFAVHASVAKPVDVMTFSINDNVVRTFEEVTGDDGDWEEVSILLNAGEHRLTWSYHYFGGILSDASNVDERREKSSWVDAITLRPFTGDVILGDEDETTLALTDGMAPFLLLSDVDAFSGSNSYIARTGDIDASEGSAEMSWEVFIGPSGGVISFAAFASLYAPRDVCEFSIDGVPQVVIATFSDEWEIHQVAVDAGKHELKWKLVKNFPGLDSAIINDVDIPNDYQGYVKIDGINLEDNSVPHVVDEGTIVAAAGEITEAETTTTVAPTTTRDPITTTATLAATTTENTTEEEPTTMVAMTMEFVECPSDLVAVEGLPGCCVEEPSYLGDGACDPRAPYNTEACAFDLGDCCRETCNIDSAYGCKTKEGGEYGPFGFFCLDPRYSTVDEQRCQVENREWIGDGGCDAAGGYNTPECGWDGGDCCEETCDNEYSFYPCGANQQYICMDPSIANKQKEESVSEESPFAFHDGFESGVFDPLRWDVDDGDAEWQVDDSKTAAEGNYYIIARSEDISPQFGSAKLKHGIQSLGGGVLSFDIQALVQIPFDDVIIMIDDDVVAEFTTAIAEWERHSLDIPAGPHLVQWIHRKNPSNMLMEDLKLFGYPAEGITMIDNIAFQPL